MAEPVAKVQKFLPKHMLEVLGKNLPAIYEAFNGSIEKTEELVQACIDQMFLSTASGSFLVKLGEGDGFVMPTNSGLDIRSYKILVPIMVASPKQVRLSVDELVQAFYQNQRTKPTMASSVAGPYSLVDGDDLIIETESGETTISIVGGQVSDLTNVSAQEIAAVLNTSQNIFLAEAVTDRTTALASVRVTSNTFGTGSFIRVAGGKLQNVLKFPNIADTTASSTTTWNLTKTSSFTDELRFTWDGTGINPNIYKASSQGIVTIRGLVDSTEQFSLINGSYDLVDVGYDYFVIRNSAFTITSSTLLQGLDDAVVFTKSDKISIFDSEEFALTTETKDQTITITVPAIPPLARRFLSGAAHLHGFIHNVLDFTRSSIQVEVGNGQNKPSGDNHFVLRSKSQRADFSKKYYKTAVVNPSVNTPTYTVNVADDEFSVFPYTVPTALGSSEAIFATVDSNLFKVSFPDYKHGLQNSWGFTLGSLVGMSNTSASDLNKEHFVKSVFNEKEVTFSLNDSLGNEKKFDGIPFASSDVIRYPIPQSDGADFYLEFTTPANAIASGLTPGLTFKLDTLLGTDVVPFLANALRFRILTVTSVSGSKVNFTAGLGTGPQGSVITSIPGARSGFIGGTAGTYFLDKTSSSNVATVFGDLQTLFLDHTELQNPLFLGPYMFDPDGDVSSLTVSKFLVNSTSAIFKGESRAAVFVDDTALGDLEFPQTGEIVIDYGTSNVEGPIKYLAFVKNIGITQILIDPAYKFTKSHSSGAGIQFIHENKPYIPTIDGSDFPVYLTGTAEARNTLFKLAELLVASGVFVESDVILPDLRYDDSAIPPFD